MTTVLYIAMKLLPANPVRLSLVLALLFLPSLAWSMVYRVPKLVLDPIILLAVENFLPVLLRPVARALWVTLCAVMLLLEWNVFPESYGFYMGMIGTALNSSHGLSIAAIFVILTLFVFIPMPVPSAAVRRAFLIAAGACYFTAIFAKAIPWGKENLVWLRLPMLRAVQVAESDGDRLLHASVIGPSSDAQVAAYLYSEFERASPSFTPRKILVLLLESWGETPQALETLVNEISSPSRAVEAWGHTGFRGSTLPGEMRELCGHALNFERPAQIGPNCLPQKFARLGFDTAALHGYDGVFYYRNLLYPNLGFARSYFKSDMSTIAVCGGAFAGICDDAVADRAIKLLAAPGPRFVYMMSLTAHLPVDDKTLVRDYVAKYKSVLPGTVSQKVNRALISHVLTQLDRLAPWQCDTLVYFAGDHNPPLAVAEASALPLGMVPYLLVRLGASCNIAK